MSLRLAHICRQIPRSSSSQFVKTAPTHFQTRTYAKAAMEKINTKNAAPPAGPYTQAIKAPPFIFVSGQIPADAEGKLVTGSIADQTRQCCESIKAILTEAGSSLDKVVKCNVFITTMDNFVEMNGVYEQYFSHKPARSCVAVKQLPKDVPVEIECIALA